MLGIAVLISVASIFVVAIPLFVQGKNQTLTDAFAVTSPGELQAMCDQVVEQYKEAEASFESGDLSKREWTARQGFLRGRYLDYATRLGRQKS